MASENGGSPASSVSSDDALRQFGFETRAIHAGHRPDPYTGASVTPLYQSSAFAFEDTESAAAYFNLQEYGNITSSKPPRQFFSTGTTRRYRGLEPARRPGAVPAPSTPSRSVPARGVSL